MAEICGTYNPNYSSDSRHPYLSPFLVGKAKSMTFDQLCNLRRKVAEFNQKIDAQYKALLGDIEDFFDGFVSFPEMVCSYTQIQQLQYAGGRYTLYETEEKASELTGEQEIRLQYAKSRLWMMVLGTHKERKNKVSHIQNAIDCEDFFAREFGILCEKFPESYPKEDALSYIEMHQSIDLFEKMSDSFRYFQIVRDEEAGEVIAYFESKQSTMFSDTQVVQWIFVSEKGQKKGLARKMWEDFEKWCKEKGYKSVWSYVALRNDISQRVHKKLMPQSIRGLHDSSTYVYVQGVPEK